MSKRDNENSGLRKEKMSVIAASVFVLSALTLTGVYMSAQNKVKNDENKIDFAKLEQEQNNEAEGYEIDTRFVSGEAKAELSKQNNSLADTRFTKENDMYDLSMNNDMDVDPAYTEVASGQVTNQTQAGTDKAAVFMGETEGSNITMDNGKAPEAELSFTETERLALPVVGNVIMEYSMDKAVYHDTMQQYRYNPALVISATEGEIITAATDAVVAEVYTDSVTGNTITFDLGDGYQLTYGQLENIELKEGDRVAAGDKVGTVAKPTIYYTKEGTNVYLKLTKDGVSVDPMSRAN